MRWYGIIGNAQLDAALTPFPTGQKCVIVLPALSSTINANISPAQKNKATSYHLGQLKAKLAKLRRELIAPPSSGGGGGGVGFDVARTGIASVGFVGFPSVGKVRSQSNTSWHGTKCP